MSPSVMHRNSMGRRRRYYKIGIFHFKNRPQCSISISNYRIILSIILVFLNISVLKAEGIPRRYKSSNSDTTYYNNNHIDDYSNKIRNNASQIDLYPFQRLQSQSVIKKTYSSPVRSNCYPSRVQCNYKCSPPHKLFPLPNFCKACRSSTASAAEGDENDRDDAEADDGELINNYNEELCCVATKVRCLYPLTFVLIKPKIPATEVTTWITVFAYNNFQAPSQRFEVFKKCTTLPLDWQKRISSVNTGGTCVEVCQFSKCDGPCFRIAPGTLGHNRLRDVNFDKRIISIRACPPV